VLPRIATWPVRWGLVQPVPQEELSPSSLRLFVSSSPGLLIGVESLERLNGGVERTVLTRLAARLAIPAAVVELLIKEIVNEVLEPQRRTGKPP
jgi:hypothetical protein